LAWRGLLKLKNSPEQFLDATLQPIIFVVVFVYLLGGAVAGDRQIYLQFVLPGIIVQSVVFSTLSIGVGLATDMNEGIFDRFRSLPIARAAPLVGAVLANIVRYLTPMAVCLAFGAAIGFRVRTGPGQVVAACLLMLAFALALSWLSVLVAMLVRSPQAVQGIGFLFFFPLTFGSNTLVATTTLPGWLQAWVKVNPVTQLTDAVRGLLVGGSLGTPVTRTLLWAVGFLVVLAPPAVSAYRRRT
jgi:oleandomycin transport system permease protein